MEVSVDLFYPEESVIHHLDARAKIASLICIFVILLFIKTWTNIFFFSLFYSFVLYISRIPLIRIFRGIGNWLIFIFFISIFPLFFISGDLIFQLGWIKISYEGVRGSAILFTQLFLTSLGAKVLTATTTIRQITLAIESILSPVRIFGFSSRELGMIVVMTIGFIPFFKRETQRIVQTQINHGFSWEERNILKRFRLIFSLLQPIITRMYMNGRNIEESLKLYGYSRAGGRKTSLYQLRWQGKDYFPLVIIAALGIVAYFLN